MLRNYRADFARQVTFKYRQFSHEQDCDLSDMARHPESQIGTKQKFSRLRLNDVLNKTTSFGGSEVQIQFGVMSGRLCQCKAQEACDVSVAHPLIEILRDLASGELPRDR